MQNLMQIHFFTRSVILNAKATQYTCSLSGVYRPHWPVQWSRHCSRMQIPGHSHWLPGYMDVTQTVLVILTIAGLFPDRPCILKWISMKQLSYTTFSKLFWTQHFFLRKRCEYFVDYSFSMKQFDWINQPLFFLCGKNCQSALLGEVFVLFSGVPIHVPLHIKQYYKSAKPGCRIRSKLCHMPAPNHQWWREWNCTDFEVKRSRECIYNLDRQTRGRNTASYCAPVSTLP